MSKSLRTVLLLAFAAALLAGCSSEQTEKNCPAASSIVDTSISSIFRPNASTDLSNLLYTVELAGVQTTCDVDKPEDNSDSQVTISFRATRPPNGGAAHYKVPYFVALSQGDHILAKKIYEMEFSFEPGQTSVTFTDTVASVAVTAGKDKKAFDYLILVGLQLTKEQLDYNRASGRLNP